MQRREFLSSFATVQTSGDQRFVASTAREAVRRKASGMAITGTAAGADVWGLIGQILTSIPAMPTALLLLQMEVTPVNGSSLPKRTGAANSSFNPISRVANP